MVDLVGVGVRHAGGLVDVIPHVVEVALSRHALDDETEDHETRVAVGPTCTRLEEERLIDEERKVVLDGAEAVL